MDGGAWQAIGHGVSESWTELVSEHTRKAESTSEPKRHNRFFSVHLFIQ